MGNPNNNKNDKQPFHAPKVVDPNKQNKPSFGSIGKSPAPNSQKKMTVGSVGTSPSPNKQKKASVGSIGTSPSPNKQKKASVGSFDKGTKTSAVNNQKKKVAEKL